MEGKDEGFFEELAAAYVSARLGFGRLNLEDPSTARFCLDAGISDPELRPHLDKFKRKVVLPRVVKVLGFLSQVRPESLLDVGTGRGTFLWRCMDEFPDLQVTAVDNDEIRAQDLQYVQEGGVERLEGYRLDVTDMYSFCDCCFDVVTALEILEHIPDYEFAITEICRVASSWVIASVPSKRDSNMKHLNLLKKADLEPKFKRAGAEAVKCEWVAGHMILYARMQ